MPSLAPIPPLLLKDLLLRYGFVIELETEHNWTLFKKDAPRPVLTIPKQGDLVSVTIMMGILDQLKMDNGTYFDLLNQVRNPS